MSAKLTQLPPERFVIEREVAELFKNGDLTNIARLLHKDYSVVSRAFNPSEDARNNPVFEIISHLWAFDQIRDGLGDTVLTLICREREKWLGEDVTPRCPAKLTANIGQQFSEFLEAELLDKSFDEQIAECVDIEVAAKQKKADLIAKRNYTHFGGKTRSLAMPSEVDKFSRANGGKR